MIRKVGDLVTMTITGKIISACPSGYVVNAHGEEIPITGKAIEHHEQMLALIRDLNAFVSELDPRYGYGAIREAERQSLHKRAQDMLG